MDDLIKNQKLRTHITKQSHLWFFHIYLSHYVKYPTAAFQKDMFALTENESIKNIAIVAFRGSAKSTIMNLSYPIWAVLGKQQKKFVLILGQTQQQARQHLKNLKYELEGNNLLKADLGPFEEQEDEWHSYSLVLPKYNARISAASSEQSVRGLRHGPYRPDLIICDDIEDIASVKTQESRDKTHQWLTTEVMPAGDKHTRMVIVGNLLHEDSLLMRIRDSISNKELDGIYREYPLKNEKGDCLWPGKYPTQEVIVNEMKRIGSYTAWQREYMLNIVTDNDRVIYPEWIKYYNDLPTKEHPATRYRFSAIGVDLAISKNDSADYTAMVTAQVYGYRDDLKVYILPNPVNKRLSYLETLDQIKNLSNVNQDENRPKLYIENVGYQQAIIEQLRHDGIYADGVSPHGQDKRARLALTSHLVQQGKVFFPLKGAEILIKQITGFGMEKYDDLADAFSILLLKINEQKGSNVEFPIQCKGTIFGNLMEKQF